MKNRLFSAFALAFAGAAAATQAPSNPLPALQALGVQIKSHVDRANGGKQPESKALADIEHTLMRLRDSAADDAQLQRKYQAVARLFGNLKLQAAHPERAPAKPEKRTRAQIDVEVVTDQHGASCANALGIGENLPVQLMLGQTGRGRSDAWLRFEAPSEAHVRFTTESAGPDPALEVFNGCGPAATKIASNDDALGLDAALSISPTSHQPLFVHLTNSGQGGRVMVAMTTTNATISGSVKDAQSGLSIESANVQLLDSSGYYTAYFANTDAGGHYSVDIDNPGDYYARADANYSGGSYLPDLYPAGICWYGSYGTAGCDMAHAQTISVASGASVSGINFSLIKGQKIAGQARDNANQPLEYVYVELFDINNYQVANASTDAFGHYAITSIPPGNYKLTAQASGYGSQMFNHVACGGPLQTDCDLAQAGDLSISNQDFNGVDFSLPLLAAIEGSIFNVIYTSPPLYSPQVEILDTNGNWVTSGYVDGSGHYVAGPLAPGSYYVQASSNGYFSQIFDGVDCASDCTQERAAATQVTIAAVGQHAQADFHLSALPSVSGHVQDAASGLPLTNVSIQISNDAPSNGFWWFPTNTATTDDSGNYTLADVAPGQYYVWALSDDHVDQLYPGIACEAFMLPFPVFTTSCDAGSATQLTVALGQVPGNFDFALDASASVSGRALILAEPGSHLPADTFANICNANGVEVVQAAVDAAGNYAAVDLPPGTYFAIAQGSESWSQYIPQLWQQIDCPAGCDPITGTPIPLAAGAAATDIDFDLVRLDAVVGRVTNTQGDPVGGTVVDLFDSATGNYVNSGIADAQGYYVVQGNTDNGYFVGTEAGAGYFDQVYAGISCPLGAAYYGLCPFTNATAVSLDSFATQPHIVDFVLQSNDPIFANGFE